MCGVAGVFSARESSALAAAMTRALRHRGPDDTGLSDLESAAGATAGAFGHRRLAIIDLSSNGHQPMYSASNRTCMTYNGEIYNFAELRAELEAEGVGFRSVCDTEVLLAGWECHGPEFLSRLRGMFALALYDSEKDRGYLIRDRYGIKPLYVAQRDGDILFASEVRALLGGGRIPRTLSPQAVRSYLETGSVSEPFTIIEGITAIAPGYVVEIARVSGAFTIVNERAFASAYPATPAPRGDPLTLPSRIRTALRESVAYHLVADVPVAVFLSGGIDSSVVAGLASEVSPRKIDSFTVVFDEADFSEAVPARDAATRFGTEHHEVHLSPNDLLNALPDVFSAMDQPSLDGLNTFVVSRAVKAFGIKVVMSGLGGDELFGGYPSFNRARYLAPFWKLPDAVRSIGAAGLASFPGARASRVRDMMCAPHASQASYSASRSLFAKRQIGELMIDAPHVIDPAGLAETALNDMSLMQQVSFYEVTGYMRNTLLRDCDVFSMVHALELRVPLVDSGVTEIAREAAEGAHLRPGSIKPMLVEATKDLLSRETIEGPKKGFTLPFETWMRGDIHTEVDSLLGSSGAEQVGLQSAAVGNIWHAFQHRVPGVNWSRPWALYTLMRWAAHNDISFKAATQ